MVVVVILAVVILVVVVALLLVMLYLELVASNRENNSLDIAASMPAIHSNSHHACSCVA